MFLFQSFSKKCQITFENPKINHTYHKNINASLKYFVRAYAIYTYEKEE